MRPDEPMTTAVSFENIHEHVVALDQSPHGSWFVDPSKHNIHPAHVKLIQPLDKPAAKFLWDYISASNLHAQVPFKNGFFRTVVKTKVLLNNTQEIKKWLYRLGIPFDKMVYLSWQPHDGMVVPWKMVVKYSEVLASGGGDLTIIDASLNWAVLFYHEGDIFLGTNEDYNADEHVKHEEFDSF